MIVPFNPLTHSCESFLSLMPDVFAHYKWGQFRSQWDDKEKNNGKAVQLQKTNSHCLLYSVATDSPQVQAKGKRKRKDTRTRKDKREKKMQDDNN